MALIDCQECGGKVSDRAKTCPHCGFNLEVLKCPECGATVTEDDERCASCGFPLQAAEEQNQASAKETADHITITTQFELLRTYGWYSFVNAETGSVLARKFIGQTVEIPAKKPFMLRARATGTLNKSTTCYVVPGRRYALRWTDGLFGRLVLEEE